MGGQSLLMIPPKEEVCQTLPYSKVTLKRYYIYPNDLVLSLKLSKSSIRPETIYFLSIIILLRYN